MSLEDKDSKISEALRQSALGGTFKLVDNKCYKYGLHC